MEPCLVCQKHQGLGPLVSPVVHEDEVVVVTHRLSGTLGYLFVEPRRHVAHLDALTRAEAERMGWVRTVLARALQIELEVELVQALVSGRDVAHVHEHVFVRHAGTPAEVEWWEGWAGAPHGDIADLTRRLSTRVSPLLI